MLKHCCCCFFAFLLVTSLSGQLKKGKAFVEEGKYESAIKPLSKAFFNKDVQDREAGLLLVESYYAIQNYQNALDICELIGLKESSDVKEIVLYSDVLVANNNFSESYIELLRVVSSGQDDPLVVSRLNKVKDLLEWETAEGGSETKDVVGINTAYHEYSPRMVDNSIIYLTDVLTVEILFPTSYSTEGIHLLYEATEVAHGDFRKAKLKVKDREYYYHDGPSEKSPLTDGKYAITLRDIDGAEKNGMKIYFTNMSGSEESLTEFEHNGQYSTGHPAFTEDGKRLYFSSDRPGGYGKFDIWYSNLENGIWSEPINAGASINSAGNELHPEVKLNRLFFSSDRTDKGYGGLDIYYVPMAQSEARVYNLRAPINSAYHDFGLDFIDQKIGYFSSNRPGGMGGFDIYSFLFKPVQESLDTLLFSFKDSYGAKKTVRVFDDEGSEVVMLDTENPKVAIPNLMTREIYTVTTEIDGESAESVDILVEDKDGKDIANHLITESSYNFEFLPDQFFYLDSDTSIVREIEPDVVDAPEVIYEDSIRIDTALFNELFVVNSKALLEKIKIYDSQHVFLVETTTLGNGSMSIDNLKVDSVYYLHGAIDETFKVISSHHNTERTGEYVSENVWKFNFVDSIIVEEPIVLENVYFAFDSYILTNSSKRILESLYLFLLKSPQKNIRLISHTDCIGKSEYNFTLSNFRSREIMNFLISKGISKDRIGAEGRGETEPVNGCVDGVRCTIEKHRENRRTEFVLF